MAGISKVRKFSILKHHKPYFSLTLNISPLASKRHSGFPSATIFLAVARGGSPPLSSKRKDKEKRSKRNAKMIIKCEYNVRNPESAKRVEDEIISILSKDEDVLSFHISTEK